jgi:hypothetical protein
MKNSELVSAVEMHVSCGGEGRKLDASYKTRVKDGCIIHRKYFMVKFSKILCCRGGSQRQQTLHCVQQLLLNMYSVGVMYNLSELQTWIKVVIKQTFQMSESVVGTTSTLQNTCNLDFLSLDLLFLQWGYT